MEIEVSVLSIPEGLSKWDLVTKYLRLRKEVFIDQRAWPLYQREDMEFEQYDTVNSVYIIAHARSEVVGGARLLPTSHQVGTGKFTYTYMIRDAYRNILPGLPSGLCRDEPPTDPKVWELTRLASTGSASIGGVILREANRFLKSRGATSCLFLGPPAFMRMAGRMGFEPVALGEETGNDDGTFQVFSCAVN